MLFVFSGNNVDKRNSAVKKLLDVLKTKRPDAEFKTINSEFFSDRSLPELLGQAGLFESKTITKLSGLLSDTNTKKTNQSILEKNISEMHASSNAFILVEKSIPAGLKKNIDREKIEIKDFSSVISKSKPVLPFVLGDYVMSKQNVRAWQQYQEFKLSGSADEELFGVVWWQLKCLLLSMNYSELRSGLKPFVYKNCVRNHAKWKKNELELLMKKMIQILHDSRRGQTNFSNDFEKILLSF